MATKRQRFHRALNRLLTLLVLALIVGMVYTGIRVSETYQEVPDFGGNITLRQAEMGLDLDRGSIQLNRSMIHDYVTRRDVLEPVAKRAGWSVSYEEMLKEVEVKESLSSLRSFIISVNTMDQERSQRIARGLALSFLNYYRKEWAARAHDNIRNCEERIKLYEQELAELKDAHKVFQENKELHPVYSQEEMAAVNAQLLEAQKQFLAAYGSYITHLEAKRSELQFQYDLARQVYTENDSRIRTMKLQLAEAERQCVETRKKLSTQKPDLYKLSLDPKPLTGFPNDILYYYENIQTLQRIRLAMMLDSIIEEKGGMLEKERKKKNTIERLLESNSCDVFIREVGI